VQFPSDHWGSLRFILPVSTEFLFVLRQTLTQTLVAAGIAIGGLSAPAWAGLGEQTSAASTLRLSSRNDQAITVSVTGKAFVPLNQVQVKFTVYSSAYYDYSVPNSTPPVISLSAVRSQVMPALEAIGVTASQVKFNQTAFGVYGPGETSIVVTLPADKTRINDTTQAVQDAVSAMTDLTVQMVGLRLGLNDCEALTAAAQMNAIEQARDRATRLAESMGRSLGDLTLVYESYQDMMPYNAVACLEPSGDFPPVRLSSYGGEWSMYNPDAPLEAEAQVTLDVTYSLD